MRKIKWLKGLVSVIICVFLVFPTIALADIIWEPEDDFYEKHTNECEYQRRSYISNTVDGSVTIYKSPKSKKKVGTFSGFESYNVFYTYKDKEGVTWGLLELEGKTGWLPMDRLSLIYDNLSFDEDYRTEFKDYTGDYDDIFEGIFVLWTYPGSGVVAIKYDRKDKKFENIPEINVTYQDDENRLWGEVSYYYGMSGWICLDDPTNEEIPAFGKHILAENTPSDKSKVADYTDNSSKDWIYPVIMVVILVAVTGIIIRVVMKNPRK